MSHCLEVANLSCTLHGTPLLTDISLQLARGEFVGIIGPNGAGKSTLLKSLVGLVKSRYRHLLVHGKTLTSYSHHERAQALSYLAQRHDNQFPFLVKQVIAMGSYAHGTQLSENQLQAIAQEMHILPLLERKMTDLSGGELQLVHFARLLAQDAPIMLLDEPTASLDIGHEAQLMGMVKHYCQQQQRSALMALHNLNIAASYCDRLILIVDGRIRHQGVPAQVLQKPILSDVYQHPISIGTHPETGKPLVLPKPVTGSNSLPTSSENTHPDTK